MAELVLPELGENIDEVDVSAVLVAVGEAIRRDQPVIEVETEKASLEVPAGSDGTVTELLVKQGDRVRVGQVLIRLEERVGQPSATPAPDEPRPHAAGPPEAAPGPRPEPARSSAGPAAAEAAAFPSGSRPRIGEVAPAAPSSRALARQLGVEIGEVHGSGPGGRISRDDVKAHAKRLIRSGPGGSAAAAPRAAPLPDFTQWGEIAREPLGRVRRVTAAAMSNAWATIPHVTQYDRADITQLESTRRQFNRSPEAAAALRRFPRFNASLDLAGASVVLKKYVHVGVAVDTERGLLVPVIRDVDRKGLIRVAAELDDLASRARSKKIKPGEMQGAGFTVSNLGGLGTTYFSPIVNWPEVAILGVGRAEQQAVFDDDRVRPARILPLSLSYDHRLIDGADAARFLRRVAEGMEQPLQLLLDESSRED